MQPIWIDDCIYKQTVYRFFGIFHRLFILNCWIVRCCTFTEKTNYRQKIQLKCKQLNGEKKLNMHSMEQESNISNERESIEFNEKSARGETKRDTVEIPKQWWVAYNL